MALAPSNPNWEEGKPLYMGGGIGSCSVDPGGSGGDVVRIAPNTPWEGN